VTSDVPHGSPEKAFLPRHDFPEPVGTAAKVRLPNDDPRRSSEFKDKGYELSPLA